MWINTCGGLYHRKAHQVDLDDMVERYVLRSVSSGLADTLNSGHLVAVTTSPETAVDHPVGVRYASAWLSVWAQGVPLAHCAREAMLKVCDTQRLTTYSIFKVAGSLVRRQQWSIGSSRETWSGLYRLIEFDIAMRSTQHFGELAQSPNTAVFLNTCPKCRKSQVVFNNRQGADDTGTHPAWSARKATCPTPGCKWVWHRVRLDQSPANIEYIGETGQSGASHRFVFEACWPPVLLCPLGT
jgi:hypothetical protein